MSEQPSNLDRVSRRGLMKGSAAGAAVLPLAARGQDIRPAAMERQDVPVQRIPVTLNINGQARELVIDSRSTLLDVLRHDLELTGSKKGCDHGQCGACTVIVNGRRINSCLSLAAMHDGDEIVTIEGLGTPDDLSPLQRAFLSHDGFQCGYCTPGQICSAKAMLDELAADWPSVVTEDMTAAPVPTDEELAERMSGNLCRCGAYPNIIAAIRDVMEGRA